MKLRRSSNGSTPATRARGRGARCTGAGPTGGGARGTGTLRSAHTRAPVTGGGRTRTAPRGPTRGADRRGARTDGRGTRGCPLGPAVRTGSFPTCAQQLRTRYSTPEPADKRSSESRDAEPRVQRCGRSQDLGARAARLSPVCPKPVEVKQMLGGALGGLYSKVSDVRRAAVACPSWRQSDSASSG